MEAEEFIEHHGVRGMRWGMHLFGRGVSGSSSSGSTGTKPNWANGHPKSHGSSNLAKTPEALRGHKVFGKKVKIEKVHSEDSAQARAIASKANTHGHHILTNEEIKKLTTRFNLEQQYSKMAAEQAKKKQHPAKKFISKVLFAQGHRAINDIATAVTVAQVAKLLATNPTLKKLAKHP